MVVTDATDTHLHIRAIKILGHHSLVFEKGRPGAPRAAARHAGRIGDGIDNDPDSSEATPPVDVGI